MPAVSGRIVDHRSGFQRASPGVAGSRAMTLRAPRGTPGPRPDSTPPAASATLGVDPPREGGTKRDAPSVHHLTCR